jgi:glyoxylase-like metal-dependent hydrolase (beta-lactamase superfamily II)
MANRLRLHALIAATVLAIAVPAAAQDEPTRTIEHIAGDVYRFQNNFHFSVFMVTPEGIIATDPINAEAAQWLESELEKRFGVPIKYLVYSHDHADHISGGEVFADTATVIAHENAVAHIEGEKRATALPDMTFSERLTIKLGGKEVELVYLGYNHSDNMIVMRFPQERIVFTVDWVVVEGVPYRDFPYGYIDRWIEGLKRLEAMDFDILATAHGRMGVHADVAVHRGYIEDLRSQVLTHMRAGKTLDEIKQLVDLEKYKSWRRFDAWSQLNVEGMYRHLELYRGSH